MDQWVDLVPKPLICMIIFFDRYLACLYAQPSLCLRSQECIVQLWECVGGELILALHIVVGCRSMHCTLVAVVIQDYACSALFNIYKRCAVEKLTEETFLGLVCATRFNFRRH